MRSKAKTDDNIFPSENDLLQRAQKAFADRQNACTKEIMDVLTKYNCTIVCDKIESSDQPQPRWQYRVVALPAGLDAQRQ